MEATYSRKEEIANAATHAVGLGFALLGAAVVIVAAIENGRAWEISGCTIYAVTLVGVYAASTLSHIFHNPRLRHALRVTDQASIYLFIAGAYTPVALTWLRGGPWWVLHVTIWSVALVGFIRKAIFTHNVLHGTVSPGTYLVLGWMPLLLIWPMAHILPVGLLLWIVGGGVCYTFGIIFFYYDARMRYFHAVWHIMVVAGSLCHFLAILLYCTQPATI